MTEKKRSVSSSAVGTPLVPVAPVTPSVDAVTTPFGLDEPSPDLRIIAAVHRGGPVWPRRVEGEGRQEHERRVAEATPPSPGLAWSLQTRDVWAEMLDAICAEGDRRGYQLDDLDLSLVNPGSQT